MLRYSDLNDKDKKLFRELVIEIVKKSDISWIEAIELLESTGVSAFLFLKGVPIMKETSLGSMRSGVDYYECRVCGMYHPGNSPGLGDCRDSRYRVLINQIPLGATIYTLKEQMEDEKTLWDGIKGKEER